MTTQSHHNENHSQSQVSGGIALVATTRPDADITWPNAARIHELDTGLHTYLILSERGNGSAGDHSSTAETVPQGPVSGSGNGSAEKTKRVPTVSKTGPRGTPNSKEQQENSAPDCDACRHHAPHLHTFKTTKAQR